MKLNPNFYYEDEVDVDCTDTGNTVRGDVVEYRPGEYLSVSIARKIKINLQFNAQHGIYIGSSAGMEFQSAGPRKIA